MKNPKVSVLMPAHNEEKIIANALSYLERIIKNEYKNIEVLVGLDGCTDNTEKIVRSFKFAKVFIIKERGGKPGVLVKLMKEAKGEIIIIHDADWRLVSNNSFSNLINYFSDPKVGGIDDYYVATTERLPILNLGESFLSQLLREFKIEKYTTKSRDGKIYVKKNSGYPFMINIFRKSALPEGQHTLCDDGERGIQLMNKGYKIVVPTVDIPHFAKTYSAKITPGDLYRQKLRGHMAKKQVQDIYSQYNCGVFDFYIPAVLYSLRRVGAIFLGVILYWIISAFALLSSRGKKTTTKEGWKMRLKR